VKPSQTVPVPETPRPPATDVVISIGNLGKKFRLYDNPKHRLKEALHPFRKKFHREYWALRDVSLEIRRGECVGIIGRNGSGKSTLLQVICGILQPTEGRVLTQGKVSALLELGAGFNPEFTGRDNVYMNGALLGFTREELDRRFQAVADFADIGDFIDQPVKTYSSGMYVRLAFAAAINVEPELLVIDEALSVGDVKFQVKCFDKFREFRARRGTIVFVTHDTNSVNSLCDRAFLLEKGALLASGEPKSVTARYLQMLFGGEADGAPTGLERVRVGEGALPGAVEGTTQTAGAAMGPLPAVASAQVQESPSEMSLGGLRFGNRKAQILDFGILDGAGRKVFRLSPGSKYTLFARVVFHVDMAYYSIGFSIRDRRGTDLFGISSQSTSTPVPPRRRGEGVECRLDITMHLTNGAYLLTAGVAERDDTQCDSCHNGLTFEVDYISDLFPASVVDLGAIMTLKELADSSAPR
jgi:ABC-type polysaccharide/polyol phosphate transport system ATPase subunit